MSGDVHHVDTPEALRALVGDPVAGVELKVYDHLIEEAIDFVGRSPFLVLSTTDAAGRIDASPKGDAPGFVQVEDEQTLVIPDRPGNKLIFGLTNLLENPHVGILMMIPGTTETLRVNGTAELRSDPELLESLAARGKPAILAIRVTVEECFFHCSKAFVRAQLWKHDSWPERQKISFGSMFAKRLGGGDELADAIDQMAEEDARTNL